MKKLIMVLAVLVCLIAGCSTQADFDRWAFFEEMYVECINFCHLCEELRNNGCISDSIPILECVDALWDMGSTQDGCRETTARTTCNSVTAYVVAQCLGEKL